jgi:hypothetical protein
MDLEQERNDIGIHDYRRCRVHQSATGREPSLRSARIRATNSSAWTTSQLGAGWVGETAGRHPIERLNGLGSIMFANRGRLLFLANDSGLLAAALDRAGSASPPEAFTYAAGFRHLRERPT